MRSKKFKINLMTNLIMQLITLLTGFILPKLFISNYGSEINGLISSISQFLGYITLLNSGIGSVVKAKLYKPLHDKNKLEIENILMSSERFFKKIGIILIIYILLMFIFYPLIVDSPLDNFSTIGLIAVISISLFGEYFLGMTYSLYLDANQEKYVCSLIQIFTTTINAIVIIILVKLNVNIVLVKLISSCIFVIKPFILSFYVRKKYNIKIKNGDKNYKLEQKWDALSQHIALVIRDNTDIVIISLLIGVKEVSVYAVYYLIIKGIKGVVSAIISGIESTFGDLNVDEDKKLLRTNFSAFETIFVSTVTIIYACTFCLYIPFIKIYTEGFTDANYIRPMFCFLLCVSEMIYSLRNIYNTLILASGHFKQTKKGAWIEVILNIIISLALVFKFGIVGIIIGTIVSTGYRAIEYFYYCNKNILKRGNKEYILKILFSFVTVFTIFIVYKFFVNITVNNFVEFFILAALLFIVVSLIILGLSYLLFKKDYKIAINKIFSRGKII